MANNPSKRKTTGGRQRPGRVLGPPEGERSARGSGVPAAVHRAGRTALERAGRGRNPVPPKGSGARGKGGGRTGKGQTPPLTVRGVGLLAGGLLLGVGA